MGEKTENECKDISQVDADKICRACLEEIQNDFFMLQGSYKGKIIADIYNNVTSIKFVQEDKLPKKLCLTCYNQVIQFDNFKNSVLQSEKILLETFIPKPTENSSNGYNLRTAEIIYKSEDEWSNDNCFDILKDGDSKDEVPLLKRLNDCDIKNTIETEEKSKQTVITDKIKECKPKVKRKTSSKTKSIKDDLNEGIASKKRVARRREACKHCGKLVLAYKMENHIRTHTKEKPYSCEKCGMCFSEKSNLNRHSKIHEDIKPHTCEICGKGFLRPSSLAIHHITAHTSEKNVLCPICGRGFKHQYFLNKHMSNVHDKRDAKPKVEGPSYQCPICGNFYSTKSSLKVHKLRHELPKAYLCNICGNRFSTKAVLKHHQMVHTGEKNYSCSICGKKFRFYPSLKTHVMVHTGEKPLSCQICNKQFRQHSHLKTHIRGQHSTERPYQCSYCHKTFKQSCNLVVHTRIHTGETPYSCDICGKGFYDSSSMKKHKKGHTVKDDIPDVWHKMEIDN